MSTISIKESFERIIATSREMIRDVNQALDRYEAVTEHGSELDKMLELGALLANVRKGREQAFALLGCVPSPNRVPAHLCDEVVRVSNALFGFIESCHLRERIIQRMAESFHEDCKRD